MCVCRGRGLEHRSAELKGKLARVKEFIESAASTLHYFRTNRGHELSRSCVALSVPALLPARVREFPNQTGIESILKSYILRI